MAFTTVNEFYTKMSSNRQALSGEYHRFLLQRTQLNVRYYYWDEEYMGLDSSDANLGSPYSYYRPGYRYRVIGYIEDANGNVIRTATSASITYDQVVTNNSLVGVSCTSYSSKTTYRAYRALLQEEKINTAPTTPSSITVPSVKSGTNFTVSWGTSTDADGDSISYRLERSVNGGSFSQIYSGSSRSVSESPLSTWNTVAYRVRAYDGTVYSGYKTSPTVTVSQSYTVRFEDYNGTLIVNRTVTHGSNATAPTNPSRTGYTFSGWSGTYTNVTSNRTITATYTINSYTVTFKDWDGTTLKTQTVNYGSSATAPSNPSRTGYTFSGWSGTYSSVTSSRTITATYTINSYTVTFKDWDGTTLKTQSVNYGSSATAPTSPSRTGYTFSGWSGSYSSVTSSRTITATYTINTFTVRFEDYDGTLIVNRTVDYGGNATTPANPTRTGYNFSGWSGSYTSVTSNQTVKATYTIKSYTVRFEDYNGTLIVNRTVAHGSNATAPTNPSRTGYTFSGWSGTYTNVTANRTITATYTINSYTVTFKDWNDVTLKTESVNYGSSATAPSNPSRTGYTFDGWSGTYTNVTSNRTITATYTINSYTVTFEDWDGTVLKTQSVNYGSSATAPSNPSRSGYSFDGWSGTYTNITSNRTITALYSYIPVPPSTPSSITVPMDIKGGYDLYISWGSSSGATKYYLYRSIDSGGYVSIYSGTSRNYTDTIPKGASTVSYRVRAYNSDGYSSYRTSSTVTVKNFPEMGIRVSGALKTSDAGWVRVDGQLREIETIWVRINGALKEVQ